MRKVILISFFSIALAACSGGGGGGGDSSSSGGGATQGLSTPGSLSVIPSASE
ncbi:MAG: Uncharacterised protein [Alphaproteobacteria bacterium]|nr:MAG: Uncharacterised protein [Alphaproteobacteria bacterium]